MISGWNPYSPFLHPSLPIPSKKFEFWGDTPHLEKVRALKNPASFQGSPQTGLVFWEHLDIGMFVLWDFPGNLTS